MFTCITWYWSLLQLRNTFKKEKWQQKQKAQNWRYVEKAHYSQCLQTKDLWEYFLNWEARGEIFYFMLKFSGTVKKKKTAPGFVNRLDVSYEGSKDLFFI